LVYILEAQGTCLAAANVVLPRWGELTTLPQIYLDLTGHFEAAEREGKRKEGKGWKGPEKHIQKYISS